MPDWQQVFSVSVPLVEIVVRGTVTYLVVLVMMRLVGQRESGGIGITDVLLVVLVAEAAAPGLQGYTSSVADGVVLVATMLFWSVVVDALAYRFPPLARLLKAHPKPLIVGGRLNRRVMRRELMTDNEVSEQLRLYGIEDVALVERAYIEPNGRISVVRRADADPGPGDSSPSR